ncbi:FHA domain-containing protein [Komarekiella delphini-convector]|uniref:FHA domain-containing protein n=1 Tax=Komarekiella delphini-convector TaxID=3050158 RepID=UPI00177AE55D|nr:FHA domain-containing protein [Komarekiella delphini-convector]
MTYQCLKGHESTESDFCSECGAKILRIPEQAFVVNIIPSTVPQTISIETCPACSAPRESNSGNFCEICGYNFVTGAHGELPVGGVGGAGGVEEQGEQKNNSLSQSPVPNPQSPIPIPQSPVPIAPYPQRGPRVPQSPVPSPQSPIVWEVIVTIDPSLRNSESPEAPTNQPPVIFRLEKDSNLIGRRSEIRGIHPEVSLDFDDAVSRRHALLNRQADGTLTLRDIDSANGTKLNGVELTPMLDTQLQDGDEFTLGHWTRITVKAVR